MPTTDARLSTTTPRAARTPAQLNNSDRRPRVSYKESAVLELPSVSTLQGLKSHSQQTK